MNSLSPNSSRASRCPSWTRAWLGSLFSATLLLGCGSPSGSTSDSVDGGAPSQPAADDLSTASAEDATDTSEHTGASNDSHAEQHSATDADSTGVVSTDDGTTGSQDATNDTSTSDASTNDTTDVSIPEPGVRADVDADWLQQNTVSLRVDLSLPAQGQVLNAQLLVAQLDGYDPGSLLRCEVADDTKYRDAIDHLGGVTWGYSVGALEDQSKPRLYAGYQRQQFYPVAETAGVADGASAGVEIVKPDIVAVTESAALFYSTVHGLLLVNLEGGTPTFKCAVQLPGTVDQFFFHQGDLVAMTRAHGGSESVLLHFKIVGSDVQFVESVSLGDVNILDSRRFNDRLVFYTDLRLEPPVEETGDPNSNLSGAAFSPVVSSYPSNHRALRVFRLGDTLTEEMHDTLIDTSVSEAQVFTEQVTADTPPDTLVSQSSWFGRNMWASDHYFVVTEQVSKTLVDRWNTQTYSVCTESHTYETKYNYCWTEYETRPNPDYVEPDNSGGDRSCQGTTLSACLVHVARVSNKTIQVPVGHKCEERTRRNWTCDAYEQRTSEYPIYKYENSTRLYIYEYSDSGFVQVDSQVHEVENTGLVNESPDAKVDVIQTSPEAVDLAVPGSVQTLYFQNGYLYVISEGVLQVYAMGGSSIVRTATLAVVNETLQSSLFSDDQLFLSDFGWSGGDHSTLRVVDLSNPAFPKIDGSTHQLPGGHRSILATNEGIFTVGSVSVFMGKSINALKLGLFSNPYAEETAYLILGTDLSGAWLGSEESQYFNAASERLLLPYWGTNESKQTEYRIGVSRLEPGTIKSEGAVLVPELAERVRRLPQDQESYLSFAPNSVEWLTPLDAEWTTVPVLEYLVPMSVYRLNEASDYVEVQRLGTRCRLYFANASDINQRQTGAYSTEFQCAGWPIAYADTLVFATGSVQFDADHTIRLLSDEEVEAVRLLIAQRPICLLSEELVDNVYVDPRNLPQDATVTCMSPTDYYVRASELNNLAL